MLRSPFDRINKERLVDMGGNPNGATELVDLGLGEAYEVVKYVHDNLAAIQALAALATHISEIGYAIEHNVYALADHNHDQRYSLIGHQHVLTDVTGLVAALADKQAAGSYAPLVHTHLIANISGLQAALDAKQGSGNYATLVSGLIPTSQLPALAITKPNLVSSQAQQLALVAEQGDVAIRSDLHQTYMHNGGTSGTMADWTLLQTPTDVVTSVNGQQGTIVLGKADVGLSNVDNTSDANKPISTVQAAAIALKLDASLRAAADGVAPLGPDSKVPAAYLPVAGPADISASSINALADVDTVTTAPQNGWRLTWNATMGRWVPAAQAAGITTIAGLSDVGVSGVTNNQFLRYNLATTKWVPATISMSYINDVDVATAAPTNGQALVWNTASSKWLPGTITSTSGSTAHPWYWAPPLAADFTTFANVDGTNVTISDDTDTGLFIDCGVTGSTDDIRAALKTLPAAGVNWTLVVHLNPLLDSNGAQNGAGIILREAATDKMVFLGALWGNRTDSYRGTMTAYSAGMATGRGAQQPWFYKISYVASSNTYFTWESMDGKHWNVVNSGFVATTAFTTRADQIGLGFTMNTAGKRPLLTCACWNQTW